MKKLHKKLFNFSEKLILTLSAAGFIFNILKKLIKTGRIRDFERNFRHLAMDEEGEVKELLQGQEGPKRFVKDSLTILKDYFIPHDGNFHKPKILRTKSLAVIAILMMIVKATLAGYLFFIYPNLARMSEVISDKILVLTNQSRTDDGEGTLTLDPVLSAAAEARAQDMIENNYFAHEAPDGRMPWDFIDRSQYPYLYVGENLAMNFSSAESAHIALMNSASHKKNILNGRYDNVGLAVVTGEIDGKTTNILVEIFATKYGPSLAIAKAPTTTAGTTQAAAPVKAAGGTQVLAEEKTTAPEPVRPVQQAEPKIQPVTPAVITKPEVAQVSEPETPDPATADANKIAVASRNMSQKIDTAPYPEFVLNDSADNPLNRIDISPNPELENNPVAKPDYYNSTDFTATLTRIVQYLFIAVLVLLLLALMLKIFIRIEIQHKPVIIQTIVVIILISGLISLKLHFLEQLAGKIAVL